MKIRSVRTKLYQWEGPVKTTDTIFATPVSLLPFQKDSQAVYRFFSWLIVEIETDEGHVGIGNAGLCPDVTKQISQLYYVITQLETAVVNHQHRDR